ncbi:MAG: squalene/phytoene synthase family protein [Cyanobacteria bacterium J06638_28]
MMKISKQVASSEHRAIANDALKDEDNGAWLAGLPHSIQAVWLERFYWIRWVDRLAEQDQLVQQGGRRFPAFYQAWQRLRHNRTLSASDQNWQVLKQIANCWYQSNNDNHYRIEINAWNCYMEAILDYHQPHLRVTTLDEYECMLARLAGSCFKLLPFLEDHQRAIAGQFGIIDQFYNNLRDLSEDTHQGICYFPTTLLASFDVKREEILDRTCFQNPGYAHLMEFWVTSYLPQLRRRHLGLVATADLHPVWQHLTACLLSRYRRIEQVMQACRYNFMTFADQYWQIVEQDLRQQNGAPLTHLNATSTDPAAMGAAAPLTAKDQNIDAAMAASDWHFSTALM